MSPLLDENVIESRVMAIEIIVCEVIAMSARVLTVAIEPETLKP